MVDRFKIICFQIDHSLECSFDPQPPSPLAVVNIDSLYHAFYWGSLMTQNVRMDGRLMNICTIFFTKENNIGKRSNILFIVFYLHL